MDGTRPIRRGVSILPSLFTTGNLFLGFWSIVKTIDGRFAEAALLIGGAAILDMLDGRIARLTGTQSEFGAQLDSLADAVSFGVAPALLAYVWALSLVPRAGWPAAFLFLVCGVMRLARFNVQRTSSTRATSSACRSRPAPRRSRRSSSWSPEPPRGPAAHHADARPRGGGRLPDGEHLPLPLLQGLRPAPAAQLHDACSASRCCSCSSRRTPRPCCWPMTSLYTASGPVAWAFGLCAGARSRCPPSRRPRGSSPRREAVGAGRRRRRRGRARTGGCS